jgi:hypothetical protein
MNMPGSNELRIPTVTLKNNTTGKIMRVNQIDYATDLGKDKFKGWSILTEKRGDTPTETKVVTTAAGPTRVSAAEAEVADSGQNETPGYRQEKRRRGRPRKNEVPNYDEK